MAALGTNLATGLSYKFVTFANDLNTTSNVYQNVFGTGGKIYSISIYNSTTSATAGILKLYDTAALVTPGTTHPSMCLPFTYSAATLNPTLSDTTTTYVFPEGIAFPNGLGLGVAKDDGNGNGTVTGNPIGATVNYVTISFQ